MSKKIFSKILLAIGIIVIAGVIYAFADYIISILENIQ